MKMSLKMSLVGICIMFTSLCFAVDHKPLNRLDAKQVATHLQFIENSVDRGLPIYDIQYRVNSLGEFETERIGGVDVLKLAETLVDKAKGLTTYVYEVHTPFQGDEGSTGVLFCLAYVTQNKVGELGYKPAYCEIYFWDDEGLWDE